MGQLLSSPSYDERLLRACAEGRYHQVVSSVRGGADVNRHDPNDGDTPLHKACRHAMLYHSNDDDDDDGQGDRYVVVDYLLRHGADVNAVDRGRSTALHWACVHHDVDLVRLLIHHGADVNARDALEQTALHKAHDGPVTVRFLVGECGADVRARDCFGWTLEDRLTAQIRQELVEREYTNRFDRHTRHAQEVLEYLHSLGGEEEEEEERQPPPSRASTSRAVNKEQSSRSSPLLQRQSARIQDTFQGGFYEEQDKPTPSTTRNNHLHGVRCVDSVKEGDGLLRNSLTERVYL